MPSAPPELEPVFARLRRILEPYADRLVTTTDAPGVFYLDTPHLLPNRKPLFFGAARIRKSYVSFYLMPVYIWPELLGDASDEIRRRMQGKSCFNFRKLEPHLFAELELLTGRGFERYRAEGYVSPE